MRGDGNGTPLLSVLDRTATSMGARLLREQILDACEHDGIQGFLPSRAMCTDNAAMIAAAGWHRLRSDGPTPLDVGATPNLRLPFL